MLNGQQSIWLRIMDFTFRNKSGLMCGRIMMESSIKSIKFFVLHVKLHLAHDGTIFHISSCAVFPFPFAVASICAHWNEPSFLMWLILHTGHFTCVSSRRIISQISCLSRDVILAIWSARRVFTDEKEEPFATWNFLSSLRHVTCTHSENLHVIAWLAFAELQREHLVFNGAWAAHR